MDASRRASSLFHVPAPAGMVYRPFQVAGIEYASQRRHTIFGDEPGLGKTVQAIGLINLKEWRKALVVCPATLKLNWVRELRRWLLDPLSIGVADGKRWPDADVVIINYDILAKRREVSETDWDVVIYDEAHYLKNHKAQRTRHGLAIHAKSKLYLTGTPVVNRVIDLWPILHAIDPVTWGARHDFGVKYCAARYVKFGRKGVWLYNGSTAPEELQRDMRDKCLVRRLKKDVLKELPAKRRQVVAFDQPEVAARERAELKPVAALDRLDGVAFAEMARVRHESALAKLPLAIEFLRDQLVEDGKVVCFAHHRDVVDGLAAALAEFNPAKVYGGMTPAESQREVDRFQTDPTCRLFIGNIRAAGVGHTLHASAHVVFVELDWTPGNMQQAEDRCHRIGQAESVLVQYLVVEGTLDANIAQTLEAKQEIADAVLDVKNIVTRLALH